MWNRFKKIGYALAVLIISAGIFLTFYADKDTQKDVLEVSLNLMGDKLMAMVPDGTENNKLVDLYENFKQKAIKGDVAPEQIENVAANILNVSNTEKTITSQQAEGVLRSALLVETTWKNSESRGEHQPKKSKPAKRSKPDEFKVAGNRVKTMFEFNERIHKTIEQNAEKQHELARQIHYQVKDGLNLVLDTRLRANMDEKAFSHLVVELEELEQEELLEWSETLSEELARASEEMQEELEALQESLEEIKEEHIINALESLKSLEYLEHIPIINADSIRKEVEKSLREAGISPQQ